MSTILKALRRLEEDKRTRAAQSLEEAVLEPEAGSRRRGLPVKVGVGVVVALGVSTIVWFLVSLWLPIETETVARQAPAPPGITAEATLAKATPKPPQVPRIAPRPPPTAPVPLRKTTAASRVEALPNPTEIRAEMQRLVAATAPSFAEETVKAVGKETVKPVGKEIAKPVAKETVKPVVESAPSAPEPKQAEPPEAPVVARREAAPAPVPVPAQKPTAEPISPEPRFAKAKPTPDLVPEPTVIDRRPIPEFAVQQIIWHPTAARRVAVFEIDGEASLLRIGEGGIVAGFTVAKIGLSAVELVRDGVALERRVGAN